MDLFPGEETGRQPHNQNLRESKFFELTKREKQGVCIDLVG
jgi:hypothetical protein